MGQSPRRLERVIPAPSAEVISSMAFLADRPLTGRDRLAIAVALANEGPTAELTAIEARRTLRELTKLDRVGRANVWVAMRSSLHAVERAMGSSRVVLGVLHRLDPVLVYPASTGDVVVTERSVRDWVLLRNLVTGFAGDQVPPDVNGRLLRHVLVDPSGFPASIAIRQRVGQAPVARAAIETMLGSCTAELRGEMEASLVGLDGNDVELVDQQIERLWVAAELKRLVRVARPRGGAAPTVPDRA